MRGIEDFRALDPFFRIIEQGRCHDLRVHRSDSTSSVVLEYGSQGKVVATGYPYRATHTATDTSP